MVDSALKWPGGKHYLAKQLWEIAKTVEHKHRVEVYGGSLAFTLASDPEGYSEVVNDLHGQLMNFWQVLADVYGHYKEFLRKVQATPFSEDRWEEADSNYVCGRKLSPVDDAVDFFVRVRQSLAGRQKGFTPLSRARTRRGMNEQAAAWLSAIEGLPQVHARLQRVVILCRPALDVIKSQDSPDTLFYLDPPYPHETRRSVGEFGDLEMSNKQHFDLLRVITKCSGKVMISGYHNPMYDKILREWRIREYDIANHASGARKKGREVECVWTNF